MPPIFRCGGIKMSKPGIEPETLWTKVLYMTGLIANILVCYKVKVIKLSSGEIMSSFSWLFVMYYIKAMSHYFWTKWETKLFTRLQNFWLDHSCRRHISIWLNGVIYHWKARKLRGKRRKCWLISVSSFPSMFSKTIFQQGYYTRPLQKIGILCNRVTGNEPMLYGKGA